MIKRSQNKVVCCCPNQIHHFLVQNQVTRHHRLLLHEAEHHWAFSPRTQGFFLFFVILISLMVVTLYLFFCRSIFVGHLVTSNCRRSGSNSGGTRTPQEERELKKVKIQLIPTLVFIKKLIVISSIWVPFDKNIITSRLEKETPWERHRCTR